MKFDETNLEILKRLKDGRRPYSQIADGLGITENTVRSRVNRMMEEGDMEITGLINAESVPEGRLIVMGVKLSNMQHVALGEKFSALRGVVSVDVVAGRYDLLVTALLKEDFSLLEFYTEEVSKIEEVLSIETFVVYKSYNHKVPYVHRD